MLKLQVIKDQINRLKAELKVLTDSDDEAEREDNIKRADEIIAELGTDSEKPTGLYAQLRRAERIEREIVNILPPQIGTPDKPKPIVDLGYVPGSLKGFRSDQSGKEAAYRSGRFIRAVLFGDHNSREWCENHGMPLIRGAMETGSNTLGGFLVPQEFSQAVIDLRESYGVLRQNIRVTPMGSDAMSIPKRLTGVTAYAVGDNQEITASDKTWEGVELIAKKWGALVKYSSELAEDAFISMADDLASEIAYAFAKIEDQSAFIGDGTSTYHGVTGITPKANDGNHAAALYTAASGNTAFSTLDNADFEGMMGKLPQYAAANAKWYISRVGYYQSMQRLMDAAGGVTMTELSNGIRVPMYLGYPVVFNQIMNVTTGAQASTAGLAIFGDLSLAVAMGERRGFSVAVSTDRYFELDQLAIKGTERVAINVHSIGDGSTTGPLVVLKTPAS